MSDIQIKLTSPDHPDSYNRLWNDPAIEERIAQGIETNRKCDAAIRVLGQDGRPRPGVVVKAVQRDSHFHFGANIFKLGGYATEELNRRYEEAFLGLFNGATVPFYWKGLEPERDKLRFTADSEPMSRRPPPDVVVEFCRKQGLRMHGHTLVWSLLKWSIPPWLPTDPDEVARLIDKRIREIAERYGSVIKRWDVVNEAACGYSKEDIHPMPDNYEGKAFESAARYFPSDVRLDINETSNFWYPHKRGYTNLIRRLLDEGAKIGGIGLQCHLFSDDEIKRTLKGEHLPPRNLLETLDVYGAFGLPLHISEITLTAPGNIEIGLAAQADVARKFYRLWFSHAAVEGITWWNLPDGGAAPGEDKVFSGLLFDDLSPKPSYHALKELIHHEWRTETSGTTDADGNFHFRGFHGNYDIEAEGIAQSSLSLMGTEEARLTLMENRV